MAPFKRTPVQVFYWGSKRTVFEAHFRAFPILKVTLA